MRRAIVCGLILTLLSMSPLRADNDNEILNAFDP